MGERGFAREVDDTLVLMDDEVVVERGRPALVIAHPRHERTRAFLSEVL
jgi:polar amino acid transport system ATP-binding protein